MDSYAQFIYLCYALFSTMRPQTGFIICAHFFISLLFLFMCERACERANTTLLWGVFDSDYF